MNKAHSETQCSEDLQCKARTRQGHAQIIKTNNGQAKMKNTKQPVACLTYPCVAQVTNMAKKLYDRIFFKITG